MSTTAARRSPRAAAGRAAAPGPVQLGAAHRVGLPPGIPSLSGGSPGYATLIKEDSAALDDVTVKRLDTIRWLALRMDELLNSLLEYSRLGRADLHMTPVSLDDVLDDVEEILGARFAEADVQLRRPMRLGVVSGDRIRLQEVLVNLISHAVKYAAADLPRWVEVGYEDVVPPDAGQPVRAFYVRDNGTGIWAEQQTYAFRLLDEPGARGWRRRRRVDDQPPHRRTPRRAAVGSFGAGAAAPRSTSPSSGPGHPVLLRARTA